MDAYAEAKTREVELANWLYVGLAKQVEFVVVVHEADPGLPLASVLLRRSTLVARPLDS